MSNETITVTLDSDHPLATDIAGIGSIQIDAAALCDAFKAVIPHASGKDDPWWHRVRVETASLGTDVAVLASDRHSMGCAMIPSALQGDDSPCEAFTFDIASADAKLIADVFKPGKDDGDVMLELRATGTQLHVTDVSGLFNGHRLSVPLLSEYLPAGSQLATLHRMANKVTATLDDAIVLNPALLARFAKSAAVYGRPLVVHGSGDNEAPLLITCGELFIGALAPIRDDGRVTQSRTLIQHWAELNLALATDAEAAA